MSTKQVHLDAIGHQDNTGIMETPTSTAGSSLIVHWNESSTSTRTGTETSNTRSTSSYSSSSIPDKDTETPLRVEKKSVRFCQIVRHKVVKGIWQLSEEEMHSTWANEEDCATSTADIKKTVEAMRHGNDIDPVQQSFRGLKHFRSSEVMNRRREEQLLSMQAVLMALSPTIFPTYQ